LLETGINARIPDFIAVDLVDWRSDEDAVLDEVCEYFADRRIAVRSSRAIEDSADSSYAGCFLSMLDIDACDRESVASAITRVVASYSGSQLPGDMEGDQILFQEMVAGVDVSGVIMTRAVEDGGPYYVIGYDDLSGRTDAVTGGIGGTKTVVVHHDVPESALDSKRLRRMVRLARDVEGHCGRVPLDIEFALSDSDNAYLFQVRPMAVAKGWHTDVVNCVNMLLPRAASFVEERLKPRPGVLGRYGLFANMTDWNPAEMIGPAPRPLAASLYRHLITHGTWRDARHGQGYRFVPESELMVLIEGRPYIDVRLSLNSFLPNGVPDEIGGLLIDAQLMRLANHPEWHDKVEFEICTSVADFSWHESLITRYPGVLDEEQVKTFGKALIRLTNGLLDISSEGQLAKAEADIAKLNELLDKVTAERHTGGSCVLSHIAELLELCRAYGTMPFARLARHAFVAESFWRSAVRRGAIGAARVAALKASIHSVAGEMMDDLRDVVEGRQQSEPFLARYGHLRPGAYDILSPRYDANPDILFDHVPPPRFAEGPFVLTSHEERRLNGALAETGLECTARELVEYTHRAVAGRELGKFIFTRALSDALESIRAWGGQYQLDAKALSFLSIEDILDCNVHSGVADAQVLAEKVQRAIERWHKARCLQLSYILRRPADLYVAPLHRSQPTFISDARVIAEPVILSAHSTDSRALSGKIVCIEQADPGYDWIFSKGIAGLVTQYGGANSHMAVRCAEFRLPAAIGCGEVLFKKATRAPRIDLDCANKRLGVHHLHGDAL
jgi:hypothetical protein